MMDAMQRVVEGELSALGQLRSFVMTHARKSAWRFSEADVEDVAHGVLESAIIWLSAGNTLNGVTHLQRLLIRMTNRRVCDLARKRGRELLMDGPIVLESQLSAPEASIEQLMRDITSVIARVQNRIGATPEQRAALRRRVEVALGGDLADLLRRDGRIKPESDDKRVDNALDADRRLQRTALKTLPLGVARALDEGHLDADTASQTLRFLHLLSERKRRCGVAGANLHDGEAQ